MKYAFILLACVSFFGSTAQVNLQNGNATFSLSLFDYKDSRSRLNTSVALQYNSGNGLKVDQLPSNIGQDWSLFAGGVIMRMQLGQPDDQMAKEVNDPNNQFYPTVRYPDGYLYNSRAISDGCSQALYHYPTFGSINTLYKELNPVTADTELDYFSFQVNGKTGVFVLDKLNKPYVRMLGESKVKISYVETDMTSEGIRTRISSFTIQDEDGFQYTFSQKGTSKLLRNHFVGTNSDGSFYPLTAQPSFSYGNVYTEAPFDELAASENPWVVNSWHLSEIEDPLTHRKILFNYLTRNIDSYTGKGISMNAIEHTYDPYVVLSYRRSISKNPALSEIVYPDGYTVGFVYSWPTQHRNIKGEYPLEGINVFYKSRHISGFQLEQEYLGKELIGLANSPNNKYARLYLKKIKIYSIDAKEQDAPYVFEYYTGTNTGDDFIPPCFFECKDIWGYYNGDFYNVPLDGSLSSFFDYHKLTYGTQSYSTYNGPDINPKLNYARLGLLKKVTYPTGGTMTYEYLQNVGIIHSETGIYYGGVSLSATVTTDGQTTNDIRTDYSYLLANGQSSMWGMEIPENHTEFWGHHTNEDKYFEFLECDYHYKFPGVLALEQAVSISSLQRWLNTFNSAWGYISTALEIMDLIVSGPQYLFFKAIQMIYDVIVNVWTTCTNDPDGIPMKYTQYFNHNLKSINPLPVQFSRVEVRRSSPGINAGKTVYEYTSPVDYALLVPNLTFPYAMEQRVAPWAYGKLKKQTDIDALGATVQETENIYDFTNAKTDYTGSSTLSCKCEIQHRYSKRSDVYFTSTFYNQFHSQSTTNILVKQYGLFTGRVELKESYTRYYKTPTVYLETKTAYFYNPANYQVNRVENTASNGDKDVREIYYSIDYNISGPVQTLKNNNIINVPVSEFQSVIKSGSTQYSYVASSATEFVQTADGNIKPWKMYEGRYATPAVSSSSYFNANNVLSDPSFVNTSVLSYNANGEMESSTEEGDRKTSFLYDEDGKFITAEVINAIPSDIAYTSFESANTGNWSFANCDYIDEPYNAPTGTKVLYMNTANPGMGPIVKSGLNTAKTYIVSFWAKGGSGLVVNGLYTPPLYTINGWDFHQYEVTNVNSVTVAGEAYLDELRLYPKNARMSTSAYDPVLGKVAECDANNRILYYTYDNFGIVIMIQDQHRNAIKTFEYNLKNKPLPPPGK